MKKSTFYPLSLLLTIILLTGCGTNPVTGKRELQIVSESQEVSIGQQNYVPSQQSQGGTYVLDRQLTTYVSAVGQKLVRVSDRPNLPYEFAVLNNSVPNAWALPGGKIAVNRGLLLELNNEAELAAVLAHEIVHAAARHGAKNMERGMLLNAGMVGLGIATSENDNAALIVGAAALGSQLIGQKYGRDAELESDRFGMKYMAQAGYDPYAAVTLQKTFVRLSQGSDSSWLDGLFASHPPSQERVDTNQRTAEKISLKGKLGEAEYKQKIAHLIKTKPAYDAYQDAQRALANNEPDKAISLVGKALGIEPRESLFLALKGDVYYKKNQLKEAEAAFDAAIKYNNAFFLYYLERGLTREKLGNLQAAKSDLENSIALLPTAPAYFSLGNIAKQSNDAELAKKYYELAAGSNSETGKSAAIALTRLDLPANPNTYFELKSTVSQSGNIAIIIINKSPIDVKNIQLDITLVSPGARATSPQRISSPKTLSAGKSITLDTKLLNTAASQAAQLNATVVRAEPAN